MSIEIKIYQMNDCDWFAGESAASCIAKWCKSYDYTPAEYAQDYGNNGKFPREITDAEMDKIILSNDDGEPDVSFREGLAAMIREGVSFPAMFATTEF